MHFKYKNANQSISLTTHATARAVLLWILLFFTSCLDNADKEFVRTPHLDNQRDSADKITEIGGNEAAIRYIDSVYKQHNKITIADKFEYYYFLQDRYVNLGDAQKAELYIDSMFWLIESTGSTEKMSSQYAKTNMLRADVLFNEMNYPEAYEYYYRAKKLAETSTDTCVLGYYNYRVALVLYRSEKYTEAIDNFKEAYIQLNKCSDYISYQYRLQEILGNIGLSYYNLNAPDSALKYYQQALELIKAGRAMYGGSKDILYNKADAVVFGNMGSAYMMIGNYGMAEELFKKSISLNEQKGYDNIDAQYTRIKLAQLYISQNRLKEAHQILNTVRVIQDTMPSDKVNLRWQNVMWQYSAKLGDKEHAFNYLLSYITLQDSLNAIKKKGMRLDIDERVANIENIYQVKDLKKKDELRTNYLLIAGIIALLLFIIVLLSVQSWRKSTKNVQVLTSLNKSIGEQKMKLEVALAKLEKADKEKDRILKAVSHDMRSPVNSALALSELLLADEDITIQQKEYLELIKNSCSSALSLTKDLLEIATLNKDNLKKEYTDINQFISEQIELLDFRAAKKNQKITLHLLPQSLLLSINPEKISRVINNLVTNAIKFSPENSEIYVSLKMIDKGLQISVHDMGIGIPEDMKNKIFDVFTEAKRFGTAGEEPYGLGLSIAKQIIDAHNGKIWFESEIGKGTTFYIYLSA